MFYQMIFWGLNQPGQFYDSIILFYESFTWKIVEKLNWNDQMDNLMFFLCFDFLFPQIHWPSTPLQAEECIIKGRDAVSTVNYKSNKL